MHVTYGMVAAFQIGSQRVDVQRGTEAAFLMCYALVPRGGEGIQLTWRMKPGRGRAEKVPSVDVVEGKGLRSLVATHDCSLNWSLDPGTRNLSCTWGWCRTRRYCCHLQFAARGHPTRDLLSPSALRTVVLLSRNWGFAYRKPWVISGGLRHRVRRTVETAGSKRSKL